MVHVSAARGRKRTPNVTVTWPSGKHSDLHTACCSVLPRTAGHWYTHTHTHTQGKRFCSKSQLLLSIKYNSASTGIIIELVGRVAVIVAACQIYLTLTPCVGVTCGHCGVYDIISWQCEACLASVCQRWLWLQQAMGETDSNNNDAAHGAIIPLSIPSSVFFFFFFFYCSFLRSTFKTLLVISTPILDGADAKWHSQKRPVCFKSTMCRWFILRWSWNDRLSDDSPDQPFNTENLYFQASQMWQFDALLCFEGAI